MMMVPEKYPYIYLSFDLQKRHKLQNVHIIASGNLVNQALKKMVKPYDYCLVSFMPRFSGHENHFNHHSLLLGQ